MARSDCNQSLTLFRNRSFGVARQDAGMSSVMSIAASGMAAASQRLAVSARNVANASGTASPLRVDQVETAGGGTQASTSAPASPPVSAEMA